VAKSQLQIDQSPGAFASTIAHWSVILPTFNWLRYVGQICGHEQGRNEGGKGVTIPQAPKSPKYFLQYSTFASERLLDPTRGAKLASWPGRHLTSLRPWSWDLSKDPPMMLRACYNRSQRFCRLICGKMKRDATISKNVVVWFGWKFA